MKVIYHKDFNLSYCSDPAAAFGRIEAVHGVIKERVTFVNAVPATAEDIDTVHTPSHIEMVQRGNIIYALALYHIDMTGGMYGIDVFSCRG